MASKLLPFYETSAELHSETGASACSMCLSATSAPFSKPHIGVICKHCVAKLATDHGFAYPEDVAKLEATIEQQGAKIAELERYKSQVGEIEAARRLANALGELSNAAADMIEPKPAAEAFVPRALSVDDLEEAGVV